MIWLSVEKRLALDKFLKHQKTSPNPMSQKNQTSVLKVLLERVQSLQEDNKPREAVISAQTAIETARRAVENDPAATPLLITALEMLGNLRREGGDYPHSEGLYLEALQLAEASQTPVNQLARLKSSLAAVYDFSQLPESAIPLYQQSIELFE